MQWLNRNLDFSERACVMGIINCTPDSFFAGSRKETGEAALKTALDMIAAGVDIIDIGGESSRPGSQPVSAEEEKQRVIPLIREIREQSGILISVDTYKTEVAAAAIEAGADMVNDIYALRDNPALAELIAGKGVPVILMHMQGNPAQMQQHPSYRDVIAEIIESLENATAFAVKHGISRDLIIWDPGIGFGKRQEDNLLIIKRLQEFKKVGFPLLMGLSRKSFLGKILDKEAEDRLTGTITVNTISILNGADIIRVHDYREAIDTVKIVQAITRV